MIPIGIRAPTSRRRASRRWEGRPRRGRSTSSRLCRAKIASGVTSAPFGNPGGPTTTSVKRRCHLDVIGDVDSAPGFAVEARRVILADGEDIEGGVSAHSEQHGDAGVLDEGGDRQPIDGRVPGRRTLPDTWPVCGRVTPLAPRAPVRPAQRSPPCADRPARRISSAAFGCSSMQAHAFSRPWAMRSPLHE